ncbi:hypothetical protein ACFY0A_46320 [Streptomyces sp. NPDC001698]|uniref:hypothetical protein n=1 Tax=Streptomyces sp. NPDC001698 TaxID=3364601 RepID=UPI00369F22A9
MSPSDWTRLTEARGWRRLRIICSHVIRRPVLIIALAGLAFLINRFGKDFPVLYGMTPLGAVPIFWSMGRYRVADPAEEIDGRVARGNLTPGLPQNGA